MFKFITVVLLIATILQINFKPELLFEKLKDIALKIETGTDDEKVSYALLFFKLIAIFVGVMIIAFIELLYLLNAVSVDSYKYPTYVMLVFAVLPFVEIMFSKKKNKIDKTMSSELKNELLNQSLQTSIDRFNKPSKKFKRYSIGALSILYYIYMVYIVFFI